MSPNVQKKGDTKATKRQGDAAWVHISDAAELVGVAEPHLAALAAERHVQRRGDYLCRAAIEQLRDDYHSYRHAMSKGD
jgi:hypothetical protein